MADVEVANYPAYLDMKDVEKEEVAPASLPVIGIIYPPPEVRNIVDKTAAFVARNGPEFESRIRQNELGNSKFNFLNGGDPYNAYYHHKVKEFKEGRAQEPVGPALPLKTISSTIQQKQQEILKSAQVPETQIVLKDPPLEFEFIADPPSISALDLDIVKLTAQFVARNGRQFLTNLMSREQRNYQFDFLRPQHSLFQYFTKLLEQYTKILLPPKDLLLRLKEESVDMQVILEQVRYRAEWQKHQEAEKRREEQVVEKERVAYAQIDWHDFVVVETVDYQIGEMGNFPPPTTPDEVGVRVLMQDRQESESESEEEVDNDKKKFDDEMQIGSDDEMIDRTKEGKGKVNGKGDEGEFESQQNRKKKEEIKRKEGRDNTQVEDMEEESSSDEDSEVKTNKQSIPAPPLPSVDRKQGFVPPLPPLPPSHDRVIVKKGYDPKQAKTTQSLVTDEMISPLTGTKIPASKVQEHMRIGLLDPRWVEQRDKHIQDKLNQESVYAPGSAIEASLKQLAERRTDIFGTGVEETAIGKKIGEEDMRKDDKITWDGHTSSVEAATRAARANITIEDQIYQIHKVKGLLPDEEKEKIGPKPVGGVSDGYSIVSGPKPPQKPLPKITGPLIPTPPKITNPITKANPVPALPPMPPLPPTPGLLPQPTTPAMMLIPGRSLLLPQQPNPYSVMQPAGGMSQQFMASLPQNQTQMPPPPLAKHNLDKKDDELGGSKRMRTEDSLEPEHEFLAKHQGQVTLKIIAPSVPEKTDWKLTGQTMELTFPLTDSVATIKAQIHQLTNMPPGKQKLNLEGMFLKDSYTLAYYNITMGTTLQLQIKERGGRKK